MRMRVVFILVPMYGKTNEEIKDSIRRAKKAYLAITGKDISEIAFVDKMDTANLAHEEMDSKRLKVWYLGHAVSKLATCDEAFFWMGWKKSRDCVIERDICCMYDIPALVIEGNL